MQWLENFKLKRSQKQEKARQKRLEKKHNARLLGKAKKKCVTALCLGGGGARGFAHIGAIKAFEECGIDFDIVVGTSVGSIIGALYAGGIKADKMMDAGEKLSMKDIKKGFFFQADDSTKIGKIVTNVLGDVDIEQLNKPFACVATDLVQGRQIIMDSGKVGKAVSASATVPLFFKPLIDGELHLVDGGLLNNIPADVARMMGADIVITVDVNPTRGAGTEETGLISVLKATFDIMGANSSYQGLINSDVIIAPDLSRFKSTSKDGYKEMYDLGYQEAKNKCEEIVRLMYK